MDDDFRILCIPTLSTRYRLSPVTWMTQERLGMFMVLVMAHTSFTPSRQKKRFVLCLLYRNNQDNWIFWQVTKNRCQQFRITHLLISKTLSLWPNMTTFIVCLIVNTGEITVQSLLPITLLWFGCMLTENNLLYI